MNQKVKHAPLWTIFFGILSLAWLFPIAVILYNSFKTKAYISSTYTFQLPNSKSFAGLDCVHYCRVCVPYPSVHQHVRVVDSTGE